jgi:hypothetical protein
MKDVVVVVVLVAFALRRDWLVGWLGEGGKKEKCFQVKLTASATATGRMDGCRKKVGSVKENGKKRTFS